jgi:hypothetical protein
MLDAIAARYHLLPSQVMCQADALDYYVMDVAQAYQRYIQEREEAKHRGAPSPAPSNLTVNKMQEMIAKVRG